MKNLFLGCFVAIFTLQVSAQDALFPTKKGTIQVHVQKDDKDQILSYSRTTITDVEGSGGNMTVTYTVDALDKDKSSIVSSTTLPSFKLTIRDNVMIFDLKSMLGSQDIMKGAKVEVTGDPMELPNKLSAGQALKDATIVMTTKIAVIKTKTEVKMHDGKCEAIENITVPAGSFKCYKVSQSVTMNVAKQKITTKSVSWYAEGVGTVKTQSFDDKGMLLATTELVETK